MQDDRHNKIRQRAYELWHNEGRQEGRAEDHWAQAEREVEAEAGSELTAVQADSGTVTPVTTSDAPKASAKAGAAKKSGNGIAQPAAQSEGPRKRRGAQSPRPA
jgi:hypothetical protein